MKNLPNKFKVSIIGCGNVGATAAYSMLIDGTPTEMVLIDTNQERAEGLLLDFQHTLSFSPSIKLQASKDLKSTANSDVIVITAGARQKEGQSRLDLINENKKIFKALIPVLAKHSKNSILLIVSNPVDILTHEAIKLSKFPVNRIFGTGTMLDTIRLQYHLSEKININPRDIQAFVLGEHGDSSFPVWSSANIAGKALFQFKNFNQKTANECYENTRNAAAHIIHDIGFTSYAIAIVIREIINAIHQNSRIVVPLSTKLQGEYGLKNVCLSIPCLLGRNGIEGKIEIPLNNQEIALLKKSAETLKQYL